MYISFIFSVLSIISIFIRQFEIALFLSLFSYFIIMNETRKKYTLTSLIFLFLLFIGLYGYSGLITDFFSEFNSVYKYNIDYARNEFLFCNDLIILSYIMIWFFNTKKIIKKDAVKLIPSNKLVNVIYVLSVIASLMEIINYLRVGGLSTLSSWKSCLPSTIWGSFIYPSFTLFFGPYFVVFSIIY